ncbi:hypothetical protein PYW08_009048 [Mythimna loreyi]|uniref:Uncharacterized protein n=1 Tax=Mythimna loreyi TaxID=667449 RepID=A0ACC2Q9B9_9NEOP|nr:hypothetical protein PYW08_009048 [Mythimna loreyi]
MKPFIIIFVLIVSTECGLLDDLVSSKAKTGTESNPTENRQGVLLKVGETLKNGTKVVIDALGNVIKISPKENEDNTKSKGQQESSKATEEIVKKEEESKADPKTDLPTSTEKVKNEATKPDSSKTDLPTSTEKVKDEASKPDSSKTDLPTSTEKVKDEASEPDPKTDLPTSTEKVELEAPKVEENQNQTLPTEGNAVTEDTASSVKNTTDSSKLDGNTDKNCTSTDCSTVVSTTRSSFKGDACPAGKSRADDGTCVDVV